MYNVIKYLDKNNRLPISFNYITISNHDKSKSFIINNHSIIIKIRKHGLVIGFVEALEW